jgi:hypothetical protein
MIEDKNKAIVITYNYLNLPSKVEYEDGRTIEYVYGTDGTKRRMTVKDPSVSLETNTDYLNAVVYEDGVIDYLMMDEGLVKNESGEYRYHYYLQDHFVSSPEFRPFKNRVKTLNLNDHEKIKIYRSTDRVDSSTV